MYKDFKNKGIRISDAIYVVKRQIEGTSPEDIEKILIYLRSNYENYESLVTRDKNGGSYYLNLAPNRPLPCER